MKKSFITIFICMTFGVILAQQSGSLDPTFGNNGIVMYSINNVYDKVLHVTTQPDGKVIVSGITRYQNHNLLSITRLRANGQFDDTFGDHGNVVLTLNTLYGNYPVETIVLENGKLLVGGYSFTGNQYSYPLLLRLNGNGSIDSTFGVNGISIGSENASISIEAMALQSDGKIVLAGYKNDAFSAFRYLENGQIDSTFGTNGVSTLQVSGVSMSYARDIAIQPDGKIVLDGFYYNSDAVSNGLVVRMLPNGAFDNSFGDHGVRIFAQGTGHNFVNALALQSDGKILCGGHYWMANVPLTYGFMVVRFNTDGSLDNTYGNNGYAMAQIVQNGENYALDMAISSLGKTYLSGYTVVGATVDAAVTSFNTDGTLNTSFHNLGTTSLDINGQEEYPESIHLQEDGNILLGGYTYVSSAAEYMLMRVIADQGNAIAEINQEQNELEVYPNPSTGTLYLNGPALMTHSSPIVVRVKDISGRVVLTENMNDSKSISVSDLPAGYYLIELSISGKRYYQKFIKK